MANAFNLTAQINLRGPSNVKPIISQLRKEFGSLNADIKLNIDKNAVKSVDAIRGRVDALNQSLLLAKKNAKDLSVSFRDLQSSLSATKNVNIGGDKGLASTASAAKAAAKNLKESTTAIENFGKQSALAFKRFAAFSIVTSGIYSLINAINSGVKAFIEFDRVLIQLQQVTGSGAVGIGALEKEITNLATSLGVSSAGLGQVAITLAQAGLSADETRIALAALAKTELAPSFDNITDTTEGAIAALRQFGLQANDLEAALGSINAVAAAFAVESSDIIAAIQRTGGVFASASKGVSEGKDALNEFISVFTSIRATTRESAETIATGLRTIFTRIQRAETIEQLKEFGVNLQDLEGKFVGPFEATKRLSEALNQLDPRDIRFATITEELGGFRQIGKVIPLIQQFATAQDALKVAQQGAGSLAEDQAIAQRSLANQIAKVREQFLALIRDVGKSTTFQVITKTVLTLTSGLISLAGAFKPILPILGILGAVKGFSAITQFASGFFGLAGKGGGTPDTGTEAVAQAERERADATTKASDVIRENTSAISALTGAIQSLENTIKSRPITPGQPLNSGGKVLAFARGGVVPGTGNSDTVPAVLTPGEFVIRKKAVETIGASNLQKMNKYASGGIVEPVKYGFGGQILQQDSFGAAVLRGQKTLKDNITLSNVVSSIKNKEYVPKIEQNWPEGKTFNLVRQPLSKDVYPKFSEAIDSGLVAGVNRAVQNIKETFAEKGVPIEVPAISRQYKANFLSSINDASRGNLFEEVIKNVQTAGVYSADNPRRPFDFTSGIGQADEIFDQLKGIQFIDAKASIDAASVSEMSKKLGNTIAEDNDLPGGEFGEVSLLDKIKRKANERRQELLNVSRRTKNKLDQTNIREALGTSTYLLGDMIDAGLIKKVSNSNRYYSLTEAFEQNPFAYGGLVKKFARGGIANAPMIDDILQTTGSVLPKPSAIEELIKAGGGAVDIDRTLKRTIGDKAYGKAPSSDAQKDVLERFFANEAARLQDIKSAPLTAFGQSLQSAIKSGQLNGNKVSIISKSKRTQGVPEYLSQLFGIPVQNMIFTQGGTKQPAIDAIRSKGPRIDRVARFALGGLAEAANDTKQEKQFGKIALRKDGQSISATYFKNDTRSGQVSAYKLRDYLYYVGLSGATKGYGPKLYDAVMEAASEEGAMLTSDRNSVSADAIRVWEYYFKNRGDVKKTPLKPDDWTRNQSLIDPKLFGKPETWPPANDPAWILQSGYSKSPSLINDPASVIRMNQQMQTQKFANGGSSEDTVPALLTPGEFVINKKAAQKIGYGKLKQLNYADKIQGFNKGGIVGFANGGAVVPSDADRATKKIIDVINNLRTGGVDSAAIDRLENIVANVLTETTDSKDALYETAKIIRDLKSTTDKTDSDQLNTLNNIISAIKDSGQFQSAIIEKQTRALQGFVRSKSTTIVGGFPSITPPPVPPKTISESEAQSNAFKQISLSSLSARKSLEDFVNDLDQFYNTIKENEFAKLEEDIDARMKASPLANIGGALGEAARKPFEQEKANLRSDPQILKAIEKLASDATAEKAGLNIDGLKQNFAELSSVIKTEIAARKASQQAIEEEKNKRKKEVDEYRNSGKAYDEFGAVGSARPAQAFAFKQQQLIGNKTGGDLLRLAQNFQKGPKFLQGFQTALEKLPTPMGNLVRQMGGLPGVLSATASAIGSNLLPQLGSLLGISKDPAFAGLSGALTEGGSMAASLGTLGGQLAGPIGAMIGTIGGAISGAISGAATGVRTQSLENNLNALGKASDLATKALENLSKVDTPENANEASKAVGNLQKNILELSQQAQRTGGERAVDFASGATTGASYGGIAAAGLAIASTLATVGSAAASAAAALPALASAAPALTAVGAALAPLTGGVSLAAVATIVGVGAAIGGLTAALSGPSQLDNEALKSQLDAIGSYIEAINKLSERRLNMTGAEEIGKFIDDLKNASTDAEKFAVASRSTRVQEAQRAALQRANVPIDDLQSVQDVTATNKNAASIAKVAEQRYYEQLALDELNRVYKGNIDVIRKESKDKQKLIERGKQLNLQQSQLDATQRNLALAAIQVQRAFEGLNQVFDNIDARLTRFSDESTQYLENLENDVANLTGQGKLGNVNRETERILANPLAYSEAEVRQAGVVVSGLAGGGEQGKALSDLINAQKLLSEKLPALLRGMSAKTAPTEAIRVIEQLLQSAGIDPNSPLFKEALDQISKSIQQSTQSNKGTAIDETAAKDIVGNISNIIERGSRTGLNIVKEYNDALQRARDNLNQYNQYLSKAIEFERKAQQIRLQSDLDLQKALGNVPTLEQMNAPFETNIRSMTSGLMGPGGSMDPQAIAQAIIQSQAGDEQRKAALQANETLAARLGGASTQAGRDQIASNDAQRKAMTDETRARNDAIQALETLASSGELAANALNALQERQKKIGGFTNFIDKLATASPEEAATLARQQQRLNMVAGGTATQANFRDTSFVQDVYAALNDARASMPPEMVRKLEKTIRTMFLQSRGVDLNQPALLGLTREQALEEAASGSAESPEAQAFKEAAATQAAAAQAMADINRIAAEKFLEGSATLQQFFSSEFPDIVRDSFAKVQQAESESRIPSSSKESTQLQISSTETALKEAEKKARSSQRAAQKATKQREAADASWFETGAGRGTAKKIEQNAMTQAKADAEEVNRLKAQVEAERKAAADKAAAAQAEAKAAKEAQMTAQRQADIAAPLPSSRMEQTGLSAQTAQNQTTASQNLDAASVSLNESATNLNNAVAMVTSGGTATTQANIPSARATVAAATTVQNREEIQQQLFVMLDDSTKTFLNEFNTSLASTFTTFGNSFDKYISRLEQIKLPEKIEMVGRHTVDVRVTGAAGFESLQEGMKNMIAQAIKEKMAMIWNQSDGAYGERPA